MEPSQRVLKLAKCFTEAPQHVHINEDQLKIVAFDIKSNLPVQSLWGAPKIKFPYVNSHTDIPTTIPSIILYELMANAVNYSYWYGKSDIRPNGSNSVKMYSVLDATFNAINPPVAHLTDAYCLVLIDDFKSRLSIERFPMISQRIANLNELMEPSCFYWGTNGCKAFNFVNRMAKEITFEGALEEWMNCLIKTFPGYANDMFLKRASLFFMMLNRKMGWFSKDINLLHIPADYQIPKILRHLKVLDYSDDLDRNIMYNTIIPSGSLQEIEIRASTIVAAQKMADIADITTTQIDDYLWLNKKITNANFHLTYTTDY